MNDIKTMPLICLRCKKDIPLSMPTFEEVSYTHYSYCEECLRKGLKALKSWDELYKRIYDHHYEIIRMEDSQARRAKLSLSNWVLDLMTSDFDYEYRTEVKPQESDHKCHTCKHYTSGEHDGSCGSYICKGYSNWESEDKEQEE